LASGRGESVFDRHLDMFGPFIVRPRVIDYDVFVRWNAKRDVDMEAGAVMVFLARCDHCHVASNNVAIVLFQPLYFAFDRSARRLRRIAPFKTHLQWDLHVDLSATANFLTTIHQRRSGAVRVVVFWALTHSLKTVRRTTSRQIQQAFWIPPAT
jgi:hypothetical protein